MEELNQSQSVGTCIVIGLSFRLCFQLQQSGFHLIVNDGVISGVRRKWKRSASSDSDPIALMTLLTTPIFYFQQVVSAFTIPLTTPSQVKTSLKRTNVGCPVIYSPACLLDVSSVHPLNLLSLCLLLLSTMVKESKKGKWLKNWSLPKEETFSVLNTFIQI